MGNVISTVPVNINCLTQTMWYMCWCRNTSCYYFLLYTWQYRGRWPTEIQKKIIKILLISYIYMWIEKNKVKSISSLGFVIRFWSNNIKRHYDTWDWSFLSPWNKYYMDIRKIYFLFTHLAILWGRSWFYEQEKALNVYHNFLSMSLVHGSCWLDLAVLKEVLNFYT